MLMHQSNILATTIKGTATPDDGKKAAVCGGFTAGFFPSLLSLLSIALYVALPHNPSS
jgi:hypothetical protein